MDKITKIAVLCNYQLLPQRVGGLDYFFWRFDAKCKENNLQVDWFFPNAATHGGYKTLTIFAAENEDMETFFINKNTLDYSHIFTHFLELCTPFFKSLKQKCAGKIIAIDHNPRPLNGYSLKKKIKKKIKGMLYSKYIDVFIGVSLYCKKELIKEFGFQIKNKTQVIFNGIDSHKYIQKSNFVYNAKFIIACHLRKDKGIQDVIEAVNCIQVNNQKINFTIDIFGSGAYQKSLEAKIQNYQLQDIFHFKGSVANLNEIYCQYDYLIHPSHGETFCYSVVEGLTSNLPIITTINQGNVLGLVQENKNGFLFNEKDSKALSEILLNISFDKIKIRDFTSTNFPVETYSLQNMVENYLQLLDNTTKN